MSHSLDQFQQQRDVSLRDDAQKLPVGDRDALLAQAILQRYSMDRPREIVSDVNGNGSSLVGLPSGTDVFEVGFSRITSIEFPVGSIPPNLLRDEEWRLYRSPSGQQIMLTSAAPSVADTLRITWTGKHANDGSTVPDSDFYAVCDLAAALCYEALAGIYTQTGDPALGADVVNYRSKNQEYLQLAKTARKRYFEHLGIDPSDTGSEVGPAISTGNVYETMGPGIDRLTHSKGSR